MNYAFCRHKAIGIQFMRSDMHPPTVQTKYESLVSSKNLIITSIKVE